MEHFGIWNWKILIYSPTIVAVVRSLTFKSFLCLLFHLFQQSNIDNHWYVIHEGLNNILKACEYSMYIRGGIIQTVDQSPQSRNPYVSPPTSSYLYDNSTSRSILYVSSSYLSLEKWCGGCGAADVEFQLIWYRQSGELGGLLLSPLDNPRHRPQHIQCSRISQIHQHQRKIKLKENCNFSPLFWPAIWNYSTATLWGGKTQTRR